VTALEEPLLSLDADDWNVWADWLEDAGRPGRAESARRTARALAPRPGELPGAFNARLQGALVLLARRLPSPDGYRDARAPSRLLRVTTFGSWPVPGVVVRGWLPRDWVVRALPEVWPGSREYTVGGAYRAPWDMPQDRAGPWHPLWRQWFRRLGRFFGGNPSGGR
jgi:hypothetical protein